MDISPWMGTLGSTVAAWKWALKGVNKRKTTIQTIQTNKGVRNVSKVIIKCWVWAIKHEFVIDKTFQPKWPGCDQLWRSGHKVRYMRNIYIPVSSVSNSNLPKKTQTSVKPNQSWLKITYTYNSETSGVYYSWFLIQGKIKSTPIFSCIWT